MLSWTLPATAQPFFEKLFSFTPSLPYKFHPTYFLNRYFQAPPLTLAPAHLLFCKHPNWTWIFFALCNILAFLIYFVNIFNHFFVQHFMSFVYLAHYVPDNRRQCYAHGCLFITRCTRNRVVSYGADAVLLPATWIVSKFLCILHSGTIKKRSGGRDLHGRHCGA